jgi:hypothetical protein
MLTGELARIYTALATLSDKCNPPVSAQCWLWLPAGQAARFATHRDDEVKPHIHLARPHCRGGLRLLPTDANLEELISLAHERGHEASWRAGTYVPESMPEERRAWGWTGDLLRSLGFSEWTAFDEHQRFSLEEHQREEHQRRRTPESEVGADTVRDFAAAMHRLGASERWKLALEHDLDGVVDTAELQLARLALGEDRCRWVYEAERFRLRFGENRCPWVYEAERFRRGSGVV